MAFIAGVVKKQTVLLVAALIVGAVLGIPIGWATVRVVNTTPAVMREDLQEDYLRMAVDSFQVNRDPNLAVTRWEALGPAAAEMFVRVQREPVGLDPVVIVAYGEVIRAVAAGGLEDAQAGAANAPAEATQPRLPSQTSILIGSGAALVLVGAAALLVLLRRARRRTPAPTSSVAEFESPSAVEEPVPAAGEAKMRGVAPPVTQNMTTYVLGDDLYDESFSIDTAGGDFLGEYGVGVSETIGIGEPKKVTALEIWLFDKNDIKTATKVLMSNHAFADSTIRSRLEAKGELVQVEPRQQILLETESLQLLGTVVDLQYGDGAMPDQSYFERLTLELAVWQRPEH